MRKKVYHLVSCTTSQRILKQVNLSSDVERQDIKTQAITEAQLDEMKTLAGSYEALFSRNALKYRSMGLKDQQLSENDYKRLILEEYTFLKRPVFLIDNQIFIGNAPKNIQVVAQFFI